MNAPTKEGISEKEKAMDMAESARQQEWKHPSFALELFNGNFDKALVFPFPDQPEEDKAEGDVFIAKLEKVLIAHVDPEEIDRSGEIPVPVREKLMAFGCLGMKIPKEYGGLGLSQTNYDRVMAMISSYCGNICVWLSAHQSIGLPQPLKLYGTKEQKEKYLPKLAKDHISAFALTEVDAGSDPAKMTTKATPIEGGEAYLINGQKLWCTNGPIADVLIVMAQTPPKMIKGKERAQITGFIVERTMPGFEVTHRCHFMGLRAIYNGLLTFKDVRVPKENIVGGLGRGLKLALETLNTGRLTVPAATVGMGRKCLKYLRPWVNERVQWGVPIGKHEAVSEKLGWITAYQLAMEATTWYSCGLVDQGGRDIRLEAAMAKMFCTEANWKQVDMTLQIRGGRGFETYASLKARGETPIPIERMLRDARINTIIEGTSEIMRLFIAREALDPHMRPAMPLLKKNPLGVKFKALIASGLHFATWYPGLYFKSGLLTGSQTRLSEHMPFIRRNAARCGRAIFHNMLRHGPKLEYRQGLLGRIVDIGTHLFAMAVTISYAEMLHKKDLQKNKGVLQVADHFCMLAESLIKDSFRNLNNPADASASKVTDTFMEGQLDWMEEGIL